jgi:arginase family enzyme
MRPLLLHLDESLREQTAFQERAFALGGRAIDAADLGERIRLWTRPAAFNTLRQRLRSIAPEGADIVFAGSGDFHHVTLLLLERAIAASKQDGVTIVHFDNHPDWVRFENGVHCGSWVAQAAKLPNVTRVITIGVCSGDIDNPANKGADLSVVESGKLELYAYRVPRGRPALEVCGRSWTSVETMGEELFVEFIQTRVATESIYITVDKDVLRASDAVTNWDQGHTSLAFLSTLIRTLAAGRGVIGADVVGDWSKKTYRGDPLSVLLKNGEALLDQPWSAPDAAAKRVNESVNLALLDLFAGGRA